MNESVESTESMQPRTTPQREVVGRHPWYRRPGRIVGVAACLAAVGVLGIGASVAAAASTSSPTSAASASSATVLAQSSARDPYRGSAYADWYGDSGAYGYGTPNAGGWSTTQSPATTASASESKGIVLIDTVLGYDNAAAAGTGMVVRSDGLILTNNHVVEGSTQISVTIASTGQTYTAKVVGTDATDDVALLQLQGATGLDTVAIDQDHTESAGDAVTAVGNAEGGGVLMASTGTITALDSSVTTASEGPVASETLNGVIQIAAPIVSGDSGGALLDADGEVIGMTTAASSGSADITAFAIPIGTALTLAQQMANGDGSGSVTIGYPAFLGVGIGQSAAIGGPDSGYNGYGSQNVTGSGVSVGSVFAGTPAESAGLAAGDTITAVDGTTVTDGSSLSAIMASHKPGDAVTVTWVDTAGATHSASVTLTAGPVA
ncbi:S1C family serine protease [Microbacterium deminutum]|uniref:PDZ domain-containing protein n=1 Tax=Microbacterium deminutum TaxID=344164 RepID=A0ABN2RD74_9MICO